MLAKATPHSSAGSAEPQKIARSQVRRQRSLPTLLRNSKHTPRTISATRISRRARRQDRDEDEPDSGDLHGGPPGSIRESWQRLAGLGGRQDLMLRALTDVPDREPARDGRSEEHTSELQ